MCIISTNLEKENLEIVYSSQGWEEGRGGVYSEAHETALVNCRPPVTIQNEQIESEAR